MSTQPLHLTLAGREQVVEAGTTAGEALTIAAGPEPARGPRSVLAARVNGELRDLSCPVSDGDVIEPVEIDSPDGRAILRHSTTHVMAQAVQDLFPDAKLGIGPPVENGFYYDFDVDRPFDPADLKAIEQRMRQIVKQGQRFSRRVVTDGDARAELADEPYKLELIGLKGAHEPQDAEESVEVGGPELTIYDNLDPDTDEVIWKDLCRGPHIPTTRNIPAFKLMRTGGAYWRGSEKNPQLQRIYGTAWESRAAQDEYLTMLAEAERRDHRKLGAELDLFSFPTEIGSGLPVFHPKGAIIRQVMEDYSRRRHIAAGYQYVSTPHVTKAELFETSGHLGWYKDSMFPPMELDGQIYYNKPMNCPMHILIYQSRGRSYRELPLRLAEFGTVYRYEKSGVVHGLTRARGFTQDDSHIFCTPEQLAPELASLLDFVVGLLRDFGLTEFEAELSTRPGEVRRGAGGVGRGRGGPAARPGSVRAGLHRGRGRRCLLRAQDRRARQGCDRPPLAAVHPAGRLPGAGPVRHRVPGRGRVTAAAVHDPPGPVRLDRAVLRHPRRALRGRVPALARAGPGGGHPHRGRARALPRAGGRPAAGGGYPRRGRRQRRPHAEEDPHRAAAEGAVHAHRRG